jgi:hypothetical protein
MRAREVRERLQGKVDPMMIAVIAGVAEDNSELRQHILTLAETVDGLINQLAQLHDVIGSATETINKMSMRDKLTHRSGDDWTE